MDRQQLTGMRSVNVLLVISVICSGVISVNQYPDENLEFILTFLSVSDLNEFLNINGESSMQFRFYNGKSNIGTTKGEKPTTTTAITTEGGLSTGVVKATKELTKAISSPTAIVLNGRGPDFIQPFLVLICLLSV